MLRAIWFAIKVGVLSVLAVWVAGRPGHVRIEWMDYTITVALGFFLLAVIGVILLSIFIYQVIRTFVDFPRSFARYNEIKRREKGYRALTLGLTAVAAGDTKAALSQARRAGALLPGDTGLPLLLQAQAARLDGREDDAAQAFVALIENKDASFLGIRGLLQTALDGADHEAALSLAEKALSLYPRQKWILKITYDLQIRLRRWPEAYHTLANVESCGVLSAQKARSDRAVILLAQGLRDEEEGFEAEALSNARGAVMVDRGFSPSSVILAHMYDRRGKRAKAIRIIEKAWKVSAHPDLMQSWETFIAPDKANDFIARLRWVEKLLKTNSQSGAGLMAAGRAAMNADLWGVARDYLERAENFEPCAALYRLRAELEERSGGDEDLVKAWLEKAALVPAAKAWVCSETGRVYAQWSPVALPHGSFNTMLWDYPQAVPGVDGVFSGHRVNMAEALIEAPPLDAKA
ncbi:MAG: heme biosynthesis protein HemY [Alphaproteobacteria bacterium]|nr:heme biosynthesis protein HemY [Alphaproteobacteria bacterium]